VCCAPLTWLGVLFHEGDQGSRSIPKRIRDSVHRTHAHGENLVAARTLPTHLVSAGTLPTRWSGHGCAGLGGTSQGFPCSLDALADAEGRTLSKLNRALMQDLKKHSVRRAIPYRTTGLVEYDEYYPRNSKPLIDEIDRSLSQYYGLNSDELDSLLNFDVKFRMGEIESEDREDS
jgi:hypothetical protein